ncbi:helix-turn-helix transcriptional regulator [uncultured Tessaracoccus sp.]|uniref:helix-turn-helix transcriptional regulator n=1 Tax=uncultured Tessaracoccus sp. TaxID=905023 RepID=UPI0025FC0772|nr:helix-turn-helix transcriptional regulator [uncultured Tessaracoccus sp.]
MRPSEIDPRVLLHVAFDAPVTLGALAERVAVRTETVLDRLRALLDLGAVELAPTDDDAQLALVPGAPAAIRAAAGDDAAVNSWLRARRARAGEETQALCCASEFASVAAGFAHHAEALTLLLPDDPGRHTAPHLEHCHAAIDLAGQHRLVPRVLAPRSTLELPHWRALCDDVRATGGDVRVAAHVDAPLIAWRGVGAAHLLPDSVRIGVDDVDAWVEASLDAALPEGTLSQEHVVRALASGGTDAIAARELGISERQFRRHVASLMRDLGATSRFQAGVIASRTLRW